MEIGKRRDIKEFLLKENERFRLIQLGFFTDIETETDYILKNFPAQEDDFAKWKTRILRDYYRLKGFSIFCRNNINNIYFERVVRSLIKKELTSAFTHTTRTDTDRYLAADDDTISYSLSNDRFDFIYGTRFSNLCSFSNTSELDIFCRDLIAEFYPISEQTAVEKLEADDNFYWDKVYRKLRPMVSGFSYKISGTYGDDNTHDIWSDTCYTLNQSVVGEKIPKPVTAKAIISYAVGIIKNKNRELLRGRKVQKVDISTIDYKLEESAEQNFFDGNQNIPSNFQSQNHKISNYIDITDKESVRCYMIVVLYNSEHPLHDRLVSGYEEKVKILFEHYLDGLSYEDLVVKHFGRVSPEDMTKISATMRQNIKRVKEKLVSRFEEMINEK